MVTRQILSVDIVGRQNIGVRLTWQALRWPLADLRYGVTHKKISSGYCVDSCTGCKTVITHCRVLSYTVEIAVEFFYACMLIAMDALILVDLDAQLLLLIFTICFVKSLLDCVKTVKVKVE